jgi:hypothetical protein
MGVHEEGTKSTPGSREVTWSSARSEGMIGGYQEEFEADYGHRSVDDRGPRPVWRRRGNAHLCHAFVRPGVSCAEIDRAVRVRFDCNGRRCSGGTIRDTG